MVLAARRGLAVGLTAAGFGAGAALTVIPIRAVIAAHGYAAAFFWFGLVQGAVVGGGLTVIANAPNPAGQALLARFFDDGVSPIKLLAGALLPTIVSALSFRLLL